MTNEIPSKAPMFPKLKPNSKPYPSPEKPLGAAWQDIWKRLRAHPEDYLDGRELARKVAPKHALQDSTLVALLSRAALAGLLEREPRKVESANRGPRTRTFYRIKQG